MNESIKIIPEAFFDFFAYFIPGSFLLILMLYDKNLKFYNEFLMNNNIKELFFIIIGGYISGHILTAISEYLVVKPLNFILGNPIHTLIGIEDGKIAKFRSRLSNNLISEISIVMQNKFNSSIDKHTFFLCENFVRICYPETGFLIRKRHAFEHFNRNLLIASIILIFYHTNIYVNYILIPVSFFSFIRYIDYRVTWPKVVFESFFLLSSDRLQSSSSTGN